MFSICIKIFDIKVLKTSQIHFPKNNNNNCLVTRCDTDYKFLVVSTTIIDTLSMAYISII